MSLGAAREAGVVSAKRVLDSTPLYDAVATQDTVTMIRSAIRQLLAAADATLEAALRGVLRRDDDYASGGKPTCDWAANSPTRSPKWPSCWRRCWVKTSRRAREDGSASHAKSRRIG